jgi:putative membrane protein
MTSPYVVAHIGADLHGLVLVMLGWSVGVAMLAGWCYLHGLRRLLRHPQGRRVHRRRAVAFLCGVAVTLAASLPPLGALAEARLSSHMAQHIVLIMVAAPLLAWGAPGQPMLAGMGARTRRRIVGLTRRLPWAVLGVPLLAWALHIGALWTWHLPALYDAAVHSDVVHVLEHAAFLGTAWLFWWHLATLSHRRLRGPAAMLYVLAAMAPGAALGAVLTFADHPIYPAQAAAAAAAGADPLLDQRIGGLVMWVPLDFVYLVVALSLFAHWFGRLAPAAAPASPAGGRSPIEPGPMEPGPMGARK